MEQISDWYDRHHAAMDSVIVDDVTALPPDCGWEVDPDSGRVYRPDGRFFDIRFRRYRNSGQEVSGYVAPKIVEAGKGTVCNVVKPCPPDDDQYLLHAKPEAGRLHVSPTITASKSNLESGKVLFSGVLGDAGFSFEEVEIEQDIGRFEGKYNCHIAAQLLDSRRDVFALIGDEAKADAFRWCTKTEVQKLMRTRQHSVSPHLLEWFGAFS